MLKNQFPNLWFSKVLANVMLANIGCMVLCNLLKVAVWATILIYPLCMFGSWFLLRTARVRKPRIQVTSAMFVAVGVAALLLSAVRFYYALEWLPGNTVFVLWDDHARIAELVSMTLSAHYPLVSPASSDFLFSFYYAALYPMAFLKLLIPILTLKDIIFLCCTAYNVLVLFSLLEVSLLLLPTRISVWVFQYFVLAFSGLDWLADMVLRNRGLLAHHEWWQQAAIFHGNAQITAFPTALFFAVHHVVAVMSCVLAYVFWWQCRFRSKNLKLAVVGLLLVNAFYSSVFVALSCLPFLVVEWKTLTRRFVRSPVSFALIIAWLVPLAIYLHKLPGQHFTTATYHFDLTGRLWLDKLLSFPGWFLAVSVIEMAGVPMLLLACNWWLGRKERRYFSAAIGFYLSTYIVAFTANNNFSMRGMLLPSLVMYLLAARNFDRIRAWLQIVPRGKVVAGAMLMGVLFAFGNVLEFGGHVRRAGLSMELTWKFAKGETARRDRFPVDYRAIARDRTLKEYVPSEGEPSRRYFNAEKFVDLELARMDRWECELARRSR